MSETSPTTIYEVPDAAATAAQAATDYQSGTEDLLGEKMVLNMGPSHPATHGVLRLILELDGEVVTKAEPDIGFLHRGDEKIAENMHYNQFVPYTDRLDYLAPLANNVAYACAVEKLMGWELPPRGQAIRVLACELARISSHLLGVGVYAMDVGAMTVFLYTFTEREKIYNLSEQLTGARFTTSYTRVGGQIRDLPEGFTDNVRTFLEECEKTVDEVDRLLTRNKIFLIRTKDVGIISAETAISYGLTGPNLRASGPSRDLRKDRPYLGYDQYDFDVPVGELGDCYDRYLCRVEEMRESVKIINQCLQKMPKGPIKSTDGKISPPAKKELKESMEALIHHFKLFTEGYRVEKDEIYTAVEAPKGEFGVYLISDGSNKPYRCKIRAPGFSHLQAMDYLIRGHMLADVPAVLGSLDIVFGEVDR